MANNFLPFCETDTGTNLLSQGDYAVDVQRDIGNQPGVARSKLVNKALRQSSFVTSQFAEFLSLTTGADILDNANSARLLSQINASLGVLPPSITKYTSGSGTFYLSYNFFIIAGNATAGATYTNNGETFTVKNTIAGDTVLSTNGTGAPDVSGTLTRSTGTGDNTLTFFAVKKAKYLNVRLVGGGGGGACSGTAGGTAATAGGASSFGSSLVTANGGTQASWGQAAPVAGGSVTINSPAINNVSVSGAAGGGGSSFINTGSIYTAGGNGGSSFFGGAGAGGGYSGVSANGSAAQPNSGSGGGGAATNGASSQYSGAGGASGGYAEALIVNPSASYAYAVGTGGNGQGAGTSGLAGGNGGSGLVLITEYFQ